MYDETAPTTDTAQETPVATPLALTAEIVSAFLSNNSATVAELRGIIQLVHRALLNTSAPAPVPVTEKLVPAVPIKKSVTPDYIVCLEDGKKLKMLKRHLHSAYNMTPDMYRARWGLPPDYPVTALNYAEQRSVLAKQIGLGRKPEQATDGTVAFKRRGGRPKKAVSAS